MKLHELQTLFHGVLAGAVPEADPRIHAQMVSDARLAAPERMHIYADMYLARLVDALRAEFAMSALLLGDEAFWNLSRDYVRAHPSEHPDIGQLGRKLADFVRTLPDARADLGDLVALERARSIAFGVPDIEPRAWNELAELGPEAFVGTRLQLGPSVALLEAHVDLSAMWSALGDEQQPEPQQAGELQPYVIWKRDLDVFHAPVSHAERAAIAACQRGATLGEVCEAFASDEDPAKVAFETIAGWFNEGWVAQVLPPDA